MFPNFTSLAQREQKRHDLLEKAQRRARQTKAKREMYAGTMWATDEGKTINLDNSKTISVQTELKKTLNDKNSVQNSDVSTNTDPANNTPMVEPLETANRERGVGNTTPMVDVGVDNSVRMVDRGVDNTTPMVDVGVDNSVRMVDTGTNPIKPTVEPEEWSDVDQEKANQESARQFIAGAFTKSPTLVSLMVSPLDKAGTEMKAYHIGAGGNIYNTSKRRKVLLKKIDWVQTYEHVRDIVEAKYDFSQNMTPIKENILMIAEDLPAPPQHWFKSKGLKRHGDVLAPVSKVHVKATWFKDASSATQIDERQAKAKLDFMLRTSKKKLVGSDVHIRPVLRDESVLDKAELYIDRQGDLNVKGSKRSLKDISWLATLNLFSDEIKSKGLTFDFEPSPAVELDANGSRFEPMQGFWHRGKLTGSDITSSLTNPDQEAKTIITDYFIEASKADGVMPIRLEPIVKGKPNKSYYFSVGGEDLRLRNKLKKDNPVISGKAHTSFVDRIEWVDTFELLFEYMGDMEKIMHNDEYDWVERKQMQNALNLWGYVLTSHGVIIKEPSTNSEGVDVFEDRQRERVVKGVMNKMVNNLTGRGLRGAGVVPLEGVVRRGRTYNLNDIQGRCTPSAFIYKPFGSKYIRIPDLDAKSLVIVQPNRRKCGPKIELSNSLQTMIKALVYKGLIEQDDYDKLAIDDKKLFKEILSITHLQHNFHDKLTDPLDSLKAEYDKLKGEMDLGNDNPSIIKQLKSLSVDMYSNRLITDTEFKDIIVRLL